jgi:precorrin-6B methylase 2
VVADKAAIASRKAFVSSVQETLENTEKVDNFIFTPQSKKSLLPFITKQTVKVGKNKYITPMQDKLQTALRSPERMLVLAQLLENDFDISSVVNSATTARTKTLKNDIQRKKSVKPTSSGRTGKRRSLADIDF